MKSNVIAVWTQVATNITKKRSANVVCLSVVFKHNGMPITWSGQWIFAFCHMLYWNWIIHTTSVLFILHILQTVACSSWRLSTQLHQFELKCAITLFWSSFDHRQLYYSMQRPLLYNNMKTILFLIHEDHKFLTIYSRKNKVKINLMKNA